MFAGATTYNDTWQNCLDAVKSRISVEEFDRWFMSIEFLDVDGDRLRIKVPSRDFAKTIETNYSQMLKLIIAEMFGRDKRLYYVIPKSDSQIAVPSESSATATEHKFTSQTDTSNIRNPFVIPGINRMRIEPQLNKEYSFDNFIEGECNRLVRSVAMSVSVNPGNHTPFNPLYIYGDSGLGKTHLAHAIGNEVRQRFPELQVLYVAMNKFQAQYQAATINKEIPNFINFYQMVDVLILDDIQELSGRPGTQNAFFNIFNHLQMSGKQLVLISDKPPVELKDIEERLLTRFKWGLSAEIRIPDYDTKIKIIKAKAQHLNVEIPEDVVSYLAEHISANIREIEGAISSLIANATYMNKRITISLAKEILKVYVSLYQKEITIEHIIETVCAEMNLDKERMNSSERTREVAIARQLAMFLAKKHTKQPLTAIGAAIGGRNHATVLHSCKTISNLMDTDKMFRQQVEHIEKQVMAQ
ncbi:MAG: chromosomal replication initiator protein DnaA [Alistipes sp.]|nr:chromosomal replication initiator protein DnaA [Alistipes sp.]